jgi:hypothetical protein
MICGTHWSKPRGLEDRGYRWLQVDTGVAWS